MIRALVVLTAALLLAGCTVHLDEGRFFHPGPPEREDDAAKWPLPAGYTAADVMLPMPDGTKLHGVRIKHERAAAEVLYFGGDVFRTETFGSEIARLLATRNANGLLIDYRGYGRSEGKPTVAGVKSDAVAVYDWLRGQTALPIVVHGFSLGSFMAAHVAEQRQPEGLVLESTVTNPQEWAEAVAPFYLRVKLGESIANEDNVPRLKAYRGPLLIVAGQKDRATPVSLTRKLFDAAASADKQFLVVPGADHGQVFASAEAIEAYGNFLSKIANSR